MLKAECRVGMVVEMIDQNIKGVVIKVNPKRARIRTIDKMKGWSPGTIWNCPYAIIRPVMGEHSSIVMKSFEQPDNEGIKVYMRREGDANLPLEELDSTDELILRAIYEIYTKIDEVSGQKRYNLSSKINSLFSALGREVSQNVAEDWLRKKETADSIAK